MPNRSGPYVDNASEVEYTVAKVVRKVERPDGADPAADVTCNFEYVTQEQFEEEGFARRRSRRPGRRCEPEPPENPITAAGQTTVKATLARPRLPPPPTTCASAPQTWAAPTQKRPATFTTQGPAPAPSVLTIEIASDIHVNSAKVSGSVERPAGADPGLDVNCNFEYISDAQFKENEEVIGQPGFSGAAQAPCETGNPAETPGTVKATGNVPVSATIIGLPPAPPTTCASPPPNAGGTDSQRGRQPFTSRIPRLTLDPPTIGYTTAEVSGTVNPEGGNANGNVLEGFFQYSTEPGNPDSWIEFKCWLRIRPQVASADIGTTPIPVGGTIKGLQPGTTYAFRLYGHQSHRVHCRSRRSPTPKPPPNRSPPPPRLSTR